MPPADFDDWIERQYRRSAEHMLRAISATDLVKERRPFGMAVRPVRGSVLASPVIASYDPDPDYFFHWARDSAVVIDALRVLIEDGTLGSEAIRHVEDYVGFGLRLLELDGAAELARLGDFRSEVERFFLQYVRDDADLRAIVGDRVQGEPRFNPDGTLDILKWSRPQHDGPATRALALLRLRPLVEAHAPHMLDALEKLLDADLGFTLRYWREPSFDIWEEELGAHYYTKLVQHAALADGAALHEATGEKARAREGRDAAREIADALSTYWSEEQGFIASRLGGTPEKALDSAVILAVIHARRVEGPHSILDPKVLTTLVRLEDLFASLYPINRACGPGRAPAMGRYAGDAYYSGGAYYFSTLAAAEFYYRLAAGVAAGAPSEHPAAGWLARGDAFMATVAAYAPATGELAEQFDQATGAPASAKDLAWSHAAFITAVSSRRAALATGGASS